MAGRTLTVYLAADTDRFRSGMNQAGRHATGLRGRLSSLSSTMTGMLGPAMLGGAALAGGFAIKLGVDGVKAAIAQEEELTKLHGTLKNLGFGAATGEVDAFIDAQARASTFSDSDLRPAFARLLTSVKDVAESQRIMQLAMDISVGTGKDLDTVVAALGKAYDGNTGALGRLGVGLDKTQLKSMSLDDITKTLAERFAGQSAAAADTMAGKMGNLTEAFEELQESFGQGFLAGLDGAETGASDLTDTLYELQGSAESVGEQIGSFVTMMADITSGFSDAKTALDEFRKAVDDPKWNAIAKVIEQAFVPVSVRISELVNNIRYLTGTPQPGTGALNNLDLGNWARPVNLGGGQTTPAIPLLGGNRSLTTEQAVGGAISNIIAKTDARRGYVVGGVLQ